MTVGEFAEAVRAYCLIHGGSVTSWGRTTEHNAKVGGVPGSAHRFFLGLDVVYDAPAPHDHTRDSDAARLGLLVIHEGDHDHLQPGDWRAG
jgi:hypothetical protein